MIFHCQFVSRFFHKATPMIPSTPLLPPPPPPKDVIARVMKPLPIPHNDHSIPTTVDHIYFSPSPSPPPPPAPPKVSTSPPTPPPRVRLSPEERLKRQHSTLRRREREEQDALREEREHQARLKRDKEESERQAREDDERRRAILQEHLRHAAARRAREEHEAKVTEEHRLSQIKERKQAEHERRREYTRELQKWRHEQIQRAESQSSEKEEERRRWVEARRSRIASISDSILQDDAPDALSGWVTIQTPDHLTWKRRYFIFDLAHGRWSLFRSQRDSSHSVELIHLDGRIESFHEWYEGFEELEAIPHSFAVKFVDGRTWLMFADAEEQKDKLLVLLSEAAGVIL